MSSKRLNWKNKITKVCREVYWREAIQAINIQVRPIKLDQEVGIPIQDRTKSSIMILVYLYRYRMKVKESISSPVPTLMRIQTKRRIEHLAELIVKPQICTVSLQLSKEKHKKDHLTDTVSSSIYRRIKSIHEKRVWVVRNQKRLTLVINNLSITLDLHWQYWVLANPPRKTIS